MTFRWQYQKLAEVTSTAGEDITLDKWFQPASEPVRLVARFAAVALVSTSMAIEPILPAVAGEQLEWYQQQPGPGPAPVPLQTAQFTYESYCFTTLFGPFRNLSFPNQTDQLVATWKVTPNDLLIDGLIMFSDNAGGAFSDYACLIRHNAGTSVLNVRNGASYEADAVITYAVGVEQEFRALINITTHTYTVHVDGVLLAHQFSFRDGQQAITNLDNWAFIHTTAANAGMEVCDVRVVTDNSQTEIVPTYVQSQPQPIVVPVNVGESFFFVGEPTDFEVIELDRWFVQRPEQILVPGRLVDVGEFVVDANLLTTAETTFPVKWWVQPSEPVRGPVPINVGPELFFLCDPTDFEVPSLDQWYKQHPEPLPIAPSPEGIWVTDPLTLLDAETITSDKWTGSYPAFVIRVPPVETGLFGFTEISVPVAVGTPGDNVIMSVLPFHEISRPMMAAFEWQIAIQEGGLESTDNAGNDIINPDTQIVGTTRNVLKINKRGSFLIFRMCYPDATTITTELVIQIFGRFNTGEPWQRLKNLNDSINITLAANAALDVSDGTLMFTDPDPQDQTVDLSATDEVVVRVRTAAVGTGDLSMAILHAKVIGGIRTF